MKKILSFILLVMFTTSELFASVTIDGLDDSVTSPLSKALTILKAVAVIAVVALVLVTALKYWKADAGQKTEVLKSGLIGAVVMSVLILVAFNVPKLFGLTGDDKNGINADGAVVIERTIDEIK